MKVTVRLFAGMREAVGESSVEFDDLPDGARVSELREALEARFPGLSGMASMAAIDGEYVEEDAAIRDGREVAFIPPVSGG